MYQKIVLWFTALAVALGSLAGLAVRTAMAETVPASLVISAVQITGGEGKTVEDFIELYNPNSFPVDLNGYRIVKRSAAGTADSSIKSFSTQTFVPAHSFFLWANSTWTTIAVTPDTTTSATLADNNGVGLRFGALDTGVLIDSVAWGETTNGFTTSGLANPVAGQSIVRTDLFKSLGYELAVSSPRNSMVQHLPTDIPTEVNDAECAATPVTLSVSPSQAVAVNVVFTNTGNTVWQVDSYLVKQLSPAGVVELALGESSINPLGSLNLALQLNAPSASGSYTYQWQLSETGALFGDSCTLSLTVIADEPDPQPPATTIRITEFLPNPLGGDSGQEIVELYNYGSASVNLEGLILDDATVWPVSSNAYALPVRTLAAGQYVSITIPAGKFGLNNTGGDVLTLFAQSGAIISQVSYSGTAAEGKTYNLIGSEWHWSNPSLGAQNPPLPDDEPDDPLTDDDPPEEEPDPIPTGVIISEVYPAPKPSDKEFLELHNSSSRAVNLNTMKLVIGNRVVSLPNVILPSGGYYSLSGTELKLPLADSGKTIQLLSSTGSLLHTLTYPKANKGQSYAWFSDSYLWTLTPTPSLENALEVETVEGVTKKEAVQTKGAIKTTASASKSATGIASSNFVQPEKSPKVLSKFGSGEPVTEPVTKKASPVNALVIGLASLGAGVLAVYKFGVSGM